ncbi:MAG: M24 family metallopeptidase [Candidatus Brocadiia bacterium]
MDSAEEFGLKCERVRRFISENNLDGIVMGRTDSFAWLGCGANNVVNSAQETGVGTFVVTPENVTLVANNIETERLLTEELAGIELDTAIFPWHEPDQRDHIVDGLLSGERCVADDGSCDLPSPPAGFQQLRFQLLEPEIERYRKQGHDASEAMENAARHVERGMAESEVASLLALEYTRQGLTPVVLLVAADERVRQWRHPRPKNMPVEQYAMLVACGRRQGLVTAMTRFVHFGELSEDLAARHKAVCRVDAEFILNTRPGRPASEVFAAGQKAYKMVGFEDEWELHHQGGAIGYLPREYIVNPTTPYAVKKPQAFAWNPSIRGTKSEDTILIEEHGIELLTEPSDDWPLVEVEVEGQMLPRPGMLVK